MHTNHTHQSFKHRLFVAVPLFAGFVVLSLASGIEQAALSGAVTDSAPVLQANGDYQSEQGIVRLEQGSTFDGQAINGTALVAANGTIELTANGDTVTAWNGGFHLVVDDASYTVSALTSPVLIRSASGASVLVPAGHQIRIKSAPPHDVSDMDAWYKPRTPQALPDHFIREQLLLLNELSEDAMLPRASLTNFLEDTDSWMLASFHPDYRNYAWVAADPTDVSRQDALLRLMLLPQSDYLSDGVEAVAIGKWADGWERLIATESGTSLFAASLPIYAKQLAALSSMDYPQRVARYGDALLGLAASRGVLSDSLSAIESLTDTDALLVVPEPTEDQDDQEDQEVEEEKVEAVPLDPEIAIHQTRAMLTAVGGMFTNVSVVEVVGRLVRVENVVIGTPAGDKIYSFSFDPLTATVSDLHTADGKAMPYGMHLQKFVEWARK